jgi:hypothetical protein
MLTVQCTVTVYKLQCATVHVTVIVALTAL